MDTNKTGGAAFPINTQQNHSDGSTTIHIEDGMTLLDYFAAKYIAKANQKPTSLYQWFRWAFGYSYKSSTPEFKKVSRYAYLQSAAMIEERKKYI